MGDGRLGVVSLGDRLIKIVILKV